LSRRAAPSRLPDQVINTLTIDRVRDDLIQDIWDVEQVKAPLAPGS
jgi:hypothetical protein